MITRSILAFFRHWCCFLALGLFVIAPHSVSYAANNAVDGQLIALENELTRLDELANQDNALTDIEVLITSLPVSEESLPSKVLQLKQQTLTLTAIQSQISQLEKLMYKLDASKSHLNKRLSALSEAEITLSQSKKKLAAIVQILSNPKNNEELPIERLGKPRQLSEKLQRLTREYGAQIEDLSLQSQALDNAIETLSQWKGALSQALIAKRNQQNQTINTELLDGRKDVLLDKINMLQHDLINVEKAKNIEEIEQLQKAIYENEMMLWLANHREQLLSLMNASALSLSKESLSALPLSDLEAQKDALLDLQEQLQALSDELSEHKEKYAQHVAIVGANTDIENTFNEQQKAIAYQQLLLVPLSERLGTLISDKKQAALLSIDLLYREQQFKRAWTGISKSLVQIGYQIQISLKTLLNHILAKPIQTLLLALIGLAILVAGLRLLKHWLTAKPAQFSNTVRVSFKTLKLWLVLRRNSLLLLILFFGIILIRVSDIPYPSNHIIRALIYAPCFLALWLSLIHLEFRQKIYTASQSLIHIVASVIMVVFCFLYAVSSMSSIDAYVLSLYEKGLMLAVAYFAWIERHHLSQYFFKRQSGNHRKFYRLLLKTINLLPWVVISICAISLIGYSRLAWQLFTYLGIGIGYFLCIFIGISLINSWRKQAKLSALKRFEHGAFVASDIVSPLSTIAKLLWIWLISALLFYLMKWDSDTFLINKFLGFFQYPLLSIGKTVINLQILALSCLAIYAIFKVARWLKTFSYHWLYARIHDLGIRGSLSIFTQYVATFIGVLIALNVLGIDLTSL